MQLKRLHEIELSLMRTAFENACVIAGLPLDPVNAAESDVYAEIAWTIQTLVERGITDPNMVAKCAVASCRKVDSDFDELIEFSMH